MGTCTVVCWAAGGERQGRAKEGVGFGGGAGRSVETMDFVDKMNTKLPNFGQSTAGGNDSKYFQTTKKGLRRSPSNRCKCRCLH